MTYWCQKWHVGGLESDLADDYDRSSLSSQPNPSLHRLVYWFVTAASPLPGHVHSRAQYRRSSQFSAIWKECTDLQLWLQAIVVHGGWGSASLDILSSASAPNATLSIVECSNLRWPYVTGTLPSQLSVFTKLRELYVFESVVADMNHMVAERHPKMIYS